MAMTKDEQRARRREQDRRRRDEFRAVLQQVEGANRAREARAADDAFFAARVERSRRP